MKWEKDVDEYIETPQHEVKEKLSIALIKKLIKA